MMDSEDSRTIYCGNLSSKVTEELLYELFLQAGPLDIVSIPKEKNGEQRTYGFITYKHECSVDYALFLFQGTSLFGEELQLKHRKNGATSSTSLPLRGPLIHPYSFPNNNFVHPTRPMGIIPNVFVPPMQGIPNFGSNIHLNNFSAPFPFQNNIAQSYRNFNSNQVHEKLSHKRSLDTDRGDYDHRREPKRSRSFYDHSSHHSKHERQHDNQHHHEQHSERTGKHTYF